MTNYYMRVSGSDAAAGTSAGTAWKTLVHALTVLSAGDTLYIGPGDHFHFEASASGPYAGTSGNPIVFYGDYLGEHTGDPAAPVTLRNFIDPWGEGSKDFLINWQGDTKFIEFYNIVFLGANNAGSVGMVEFGESIGAFGMDGIVIEDCIFLTKGREERRDGDALTFNYGDGDTPVGDGARVRRCLFTDYVNIKCDDNAVANFDIDFLIESCVFTDSAHLQVDAQSGTYQITGLTMRNCSGVANHPGQMVGFNYPRDPTQTLDMSGIVSQGGGLFDSSSGTASCLINYCQVQDIGGGIAIDLVEGVNTLATPDRDSQPFGNLFGWEANMLYEKWFGVRPYMTWEPVDDIGLKANCIGGANPDSKATLDFFGRPFDGNRDRSYVFAGWYNGDFVSTIFTVLYTWQDPDTVWSNEAQINESRSFQEATCATNGSIATNFLHIEKPSVNISDNQTIQSVWIRFAGMLDGDGNTLNFNFYTLDEGEDLGGFSITGPGTGGREDSWYDLEEIPNAPAGGWTPTHLRNLECRMWQTGNGDVQVQRLLVYIDTGDQDSGAIASRGNLSIETTIVDTGSQSLKIDRAGFYQTTVPVVANTSITVNVEVYRDGNYGGTDYPELQVFNIPGEYNEYTFEDIGAELAWNTLTQQFVPTQNGFATVRLVSRDTSKNGATYFDNLRWS